VFGNRVLTKILGPKRDEITGEYNEEHKDLYSSKNIIRMIKTNEMGRACNKYGAEER